MAENRVQITINGDGSNAIAASKQVRNEYSLLSSQLQTGIQQAAYGVDAGTARIVKSYRDMSSQVRTQTRQMRDDTIHDVMTMNERILQYAEETRRRELAVYQTPDAMRARWGLSPRDDQARMDAGLEPLGNQQYAAADAVRETNRGISDQTVAIGAAALKWGSLGAVVAGVSEIAITAYQRMEEAAKSYLEQAEKVAMATHATGISSGQIQDIQAASRMAGFDFEVLLQGYKNISQALAGLETDTNKAKGALDAMHISLVNDSGQTKTFNEVIVAIADQFAAYEDGVNKSKLATELFGSAQGQLIAMLNKGGSAVQQYLAVGQSMTDAEVKKAEAIKEGERIQELAVQQANASMGKAWSDLTSDLWHTSNTWDDAMRVMGQTVTQFGNLATTVFNRVKVSVGLLPPSIEALKSAAKSNLVVPGEVINVGQPVTGSRESSQAPTILSASDFEKSLTQRRNMEANLFTWESETTSKYWRDAYNWASSYYGKESALAKQLWDKYADSARAAYKSAESGGSGADPFGVEQVREKIHQIDSDFRTMYREYRNEQYAFWTQEKELQGQSYEAERLKNFQWLENAAANLRQQSEKAQNDIQSLVDKKNTSRGMTPDAEALIDREIARLTELKNLDEQRYQELLKQYELREKMAAKIQLREAAEIAQVNLSYAQLTGTMEDQIRAQLALNEAQKQAKLLEVGGEVTELGQAYRRLYDEQERLLRLNNGEYGSWEAFKQGLRDARQAAGTEFQAIRQMGSDLSSSLRSEFNSVFSRFFKGELKSAEDFFKAFCDAIVNAFGNAVSNMLSKWVESQLTSLIGGLGGFFQNLGNSKRFATSDIITEGLFDRRASGGDVLAGRAYLVGERGPELFLPGRSGTVLPNGQTANRAQSLNVRVSIDNQSSTPLKLEQGSVTQGIDKVVIGIVAKDIDENGVLGRMFRGRR